MPSEAFTRYEQRDGAAWITLNRPEARNALSAGLVTEVYDHLTAANADDAVRVIVITGAGNDYDYRKIRDAAVTSVPLVSMLRQAPPPPQPKAGWQVRREGRPGGKSGGGKGAKASMGDHDMETIEGYEGDGENEAFVTQVKKFQSRHGQEQGLLQDTWGADF